ncbi:MAG: PrsW family intramembrane metalloprotease [Calditrichia bacterium]|nr:PrsW family intramembrane metalloprotease [Calditrichia bacterium]
MTDTILSVAAGILPVSIFLVILIFLDTYKLVRLTHILRTLLIGGFIALLCYVLNNLLLQVVPLSVTTYARYLAPLLEEMLKAAYLIHLIRRRKIGFLVDAAIYGFALGTGFAVVENVYYLQALSSNNILIWVIRGFGTAVMHGGTTALFSILSLNLSSRFPRRQFSNFIPGLALAIFIHSFFNHFIFHPVFMTIGQIILLPLILAITYSRSEKALQEWLEAGMDVDVWLLDYINTGRLYQTKIGEYLQQLKNQFGGEVVADMICYVRLNLELAIRAKGIILMRESGFSIPKDPEISEKLTELKFLEKSIGKSGKLALSPLLHTGIQEFWQLSLIDQKK